MFNGEMFKEMATRLHEHNQETKRMLNREKDFFDAHKIETMKSAEKLGKKMYEKEQEEKRMQIKTIELLSEQNESLKRLVEDSKNAVEQRNAIIHFMVEEMIKSEQPKEIKRDFLLNLLVPIATVSSGAGDLMQMVKSSLESIN